jgi:hypothetical protein
MRCVSVAQCRYRAYIIQMHLTLPRRGDAGSYRGTSLLKACIHSLVCKRVDFVAACECSRQEYTMFSVNGWQSIDFRHHCVVSQQAVTLIG